MPQSPLHFGKAPREPACLERAGAITVGTKKGQATELLMGVTTGEKANSSCREASQLTKENPSHGQVESGQPSGNGHLICCTGQAKTTTTGRSPSSDQQAFEELELKSLKSLVTLR